MHLAQQQSSYFCCSSDKLVTFLVTKKRSGSSNMSGNGSDFENDGDFMQEPSSKKIKLEGTVGGHSEVLQLHTEWEQREAAARHAAYTTDADVPVPVPQSDFEIEINSSNQEGPTSPGHEITLASSSVPMQIEPRILTIDSVSGVAHGGDVAVHQNTAIPSSDHQTQQQQPQTMLSPTTPDDGTTEQSPTNVTAHHDFSSLIVAAGRSGLLPPVSDSLTGTDLASSQFILQSQSRSATDGSQSGGPLYVMIPPTSNGADLLQAAMQQQQQQQQQHSPTTPGQRPIVPRLATGAIMEASDDQRKQKEYIRKQTHNEVERRRRDRINELIKMLAEIVPGCQKKDASNGNIVGYVYSKGTVLEKTVEYVRELLTQNDQLSATAKLAEKSAGALQVLQNQITVLEKENAFLRAQMIQLGIDSSSTSLNTRALLSNPLTQSLLNHPQVAAVPAAIPNTTQLLMSLAQTLTSNPLLSSLNQPAAVQHSSNDTSQHHQQQTSIATGTSSATTSTDSTNGTNGSTSTAATAVAPSNNTPTAAPVNSNSHQQQQQNNMSNLVVNSLVQTLANSISGTSSSPVHVLPPPSQSSSTAAAINLLNSLIMAQSALTAATTTTPSATPSSDTAANLLLSQSTSPEKTQT